jgi:hypothetical protein
MLGCRRCLHATASLQNSYKPHGQETLAAHESRRNYTVALVKIATHGDPNGLDGHLPTTVSSPKYYGLTTTDRLDWLPSQAYHRMHRPGQHPPPATHFTQGVEQFMSHLIARRVVQRLKKTLAWRWDAISE